MRFKIWPLIVVCMVSTAVLALAVLLILAVNGNHGNAKPQPAESPGEFAAGFEETVFKLHNVQQAYKMLCADGYNYHTSWVDSQIKFWSGPDVVIQPYDFRAVKSILLEGPLLEKRAQYKVWVAYHYSYYFQGKILAHEYNTDANSGGTYVTKLDDDYCASPWAGG